MIWLYLQLFTNLIKGLNQLDVAKRFIRYKVPLSSMTRPVGSTSGTLSEKGSVKVIELANVCSLNYKCNHS